MGDAVLFKTARCAGKHLGPGSYDLSSTLNNGKCIPVQFPLYDSSRLPALPDFGGKTLGLPLQTPHRKGVTEVLSRSLYGNDYPAKVNQHPGRLYQVDKPFSHPFFGLVLELTKHVRPLN